MTILLVDGGNYYPCVVNYCENRGQCLAMTTSPNAMAYQAKPDKKLDGSRFFMTPEVKTRLEAKAFCDENNGQLFAIETTTDGELWIKS